MAINLSTLVNQTNPLQLAKAWVNFNGTTATPSTIRSSYNVSSVTKNSTGDYTVNFATAMADANYTTVASFGDTGNTAFAAASNVGFAVSTSSVRVRSLAVGASPSTQDADQANVQIFGN